MKKDESPLRSQEQQQVQQPQQQSPREAEQPPAKEIRRRLGSPEEAKTRATRHLSPVKTQRPSFDDIFIRICTQVKLIGKIDPWPDSERSAAKTKQSALLLGRRLRHRGSAAPSAVTSSAAQVGFAA